jgi:hypothetical protein
MPFRLKGNERGDFHEVSSTKSIVTINTALPTVGDEVAYLSGASLRDYDIAVFDTSLPHEALERVDFSGGGSCIAIESTRLLSAAFKHWNSEIRGALRSGKTVFVLVAEKDDDSGAVSVTTGVRNARNYQTQSLHNYLALPLTLSVRNTKGRVMKAVDSRFRGLLDAIKDVASYQAILADSVGTTAIAAKDGAAVASVLQLEGLPGHIVLLPYFNMTAFSAKASEKQQTSHRIVSQLVAVDRALTAESEMTPPPSWVADAPLPQQVSAIEVEIADIDNEIAGLAQRKDKKLRERDGSMAHSRLLFEGGKQLEAAIEDALKLLGYTVENYRNGDLEIDHIIVGPASIRMIGESEGKDNAPIDISKFRQLESNINEDFQREDVAAPAKGLLFGNAYRFTEPSLRAEQFTAKCFTNAERLGTALVRTSDLYTVVISALDHPEDQAFLEECRKALEETKGGIVVFPTRS